MARVPDIHPRPMKGDLRHMWIIVFFDLPVKKPKQRPVYAKDRRPSPNTSNAPKPICRRKAPSVPCKSRTNNTPACAFYSEISSQKKHPVANNCFFSDAKTLQLTDKQQVGGLVVYPN